MQKTKSCVAFIIIIRFFNQTSLQSQQRREQINGINQTWFCGAYWYNGFHEDGVRSALDVVKGLSSLVTQYLQKGAA
ncbi:hypothetical protein QW180_02380 [Vibrio sinaloensis]|nr:hypothetical protein [Vibrio sinaloensis]